jgi:transposase
MQKTRVRLAPHERRELRKRVRTRTLRADDVRRARLILLLAEGQSYTAIQAALGCNATFITRWKARFVAERLAGLYARHRGKAVATRTPKLEAKILERTRRPPRDGSTHWSTRKLARELRVSHMMVARVWGRANLKPHRLDRYMRSTDPEFETKAADIIGLYVNPPQHAAVFCVDEKPQIQAIPPIDQPFVLTPEGVKNLKPQPGEPAFLADVIPKGGQEFEESH